MNRARSLAAVTLALCALPLAAPAQEMPEAPTAGGRRVMSVLGDVARTLRTTRYRHDTVVNAREGRYEWDCSAMAGWVLSRSVPISRRAVPGGRPLAVDFFRTIRATPTTRYRNGWTQLARVDMAMPGDVVAWQMPRWFHSRSTGHVAFVAAPATRTARGVLLRIIDATSVPHDRDTRTYGAGGGYGEGTLLVVTDDSGRGVAYGWAGDRTPDDWITPTPVVVGRVR